MTLEKLFDDKTLSEIAEEFERQLRAYYEANWPGSSQPRAEAVDAAVIVHYGPVGHRMSMTRAETVRFLDILAGSTSGPSQAIQEGTAANA